MDYIGRHGDQLGRNDDAFLDDFIAKLQENNQDNMPVNAGDCDAFVW